MKEYELNRVPYIKNLKELINLRGNMQNEIVFQYKKRKEMVNVTTEQFQNEVNALGTYLYSQGIRNEKIALVGENSYEWILFYLAVVNGGNVIVPIDKELSDEEILVLIEKSGVSGLIYSRTYDGIAEKRQDLKLFSMKNFSKYILEGNEQIQNGNNEFADFEIDPEVLCSIIYTSGTTGTQKGVMLNQKNFASDIMSAAENVSISGATLLTLPLHHTFAFSTSVLAVMLCGKTICINSSLRTFQQDLKDFKPQNMFLVPLYVETMYKNVWNAAKKQGKEKILRRMITISGILRRLGLDLRKKLFQSVLEEFGGKLDLIICGGAFLSEIYIKGFDDLGITVLNGYGITECAPVVAVNRNHGIMKGSVGKILSCNQVKIKDGEILIKGNNVMLGYYGDEQSTTQAFEGKWFRTGDLGYVKDNYLFITGRKKNLIILSNGKNVSPEEIEEKIQKIESVLEVIVYEENQGITAEIYAEDQTGIQEQINEYNKTMPMYKQVQKVKFRDTEFVKTTTKKIKR